MRLHRVPATLWQHAAKPGNMHIGDVEDTPFAICEGRPSFAVLESGFLAVTVEGSFEAKLQFATSGLAHIFVSPDNRTMVPTPAFIKAQGVAKQVTGGNLTTIALQTEPMTSKLIFVVSEERKAKLMSDVSMIHIRLHENG